MEISHNKPSFNEDEIFAVKEVIESKEIVRGIKVQEFEKLICKYVGANPNSGIAVSNGSSAIYLSLKVLNIKEGDEIIIPTYVCSAVLNAIFMVGAKPVLVDIEDIDFNIAYEEIKNNITQKTKVIIVPHTFGIAADIERIKKFNIPIIEDCAQALGTEIDNKKVGILGDISIFSFYASKVITTGQGGMIISKDINLINKVRDYISFDYKQNYYPRFNFEMTDIQGAMGIAQFKKINKFLSKRKEIADSYKNVCNEKGWDFQKPKKENIIQNWYRFVIKTDEDTIINIKDTLKEEKIKSIVPIEQWELLSNYLKLDSSNFNIANNVSKTTLSLPIYPDLIEEKKVDTIINALRKCF